jgi:FkbM family methyltransferase
MPLNSQGYYEQIRRIRRTLRKRPRTWAVDPLGYLDEYDLSPIGSTIQLEAHLLNVLNTFVLQQYQLVRPNISVAAKSGDVVIDAGACWGDTTLYFAERVGPTGQVLSYEFAPENLEVLRRNLQRNPGLARRVRLLTRALSDTPERQVSFSGAGPGTRMSAREDSESSTITDTIDARVESDRLSKVDFIKMDIEGGELGALRGAEQTLRHWRPTLAISIYHSLDDLWQIATYIADLRLGYQFYVAHFTIHAEETVLFALA